MAQDTATARSAGEKPAGQNHSTPARRTTEWQLLLRLMAPYKGLIFWLVVTLLCDITGMLVIPTQLSALLNSAISTRDVAEVGRHGAVMLVAALVGSGGCIVSYRLAARLAANMGRDLRCAVYRKSLSLSGFEFGQLGAGSMITRTLSDANVVQQTILMSFVMISPVPVTCVIATVLAFGIDPVMGWALLAVIVATLGIMVLAVWRSAPVFTILQGYIDRMNTRLRESMTGVRVIRAFGKEAHERARLERTFEDYATRAIRVNLVFATVDSLTFFLMNAVEALVIWLGADRVGAHAMQIGSISALLEYAMLIMFFMMMAQFCVLQIPRALACLARANEVLDINPSITDPTGKLGTEENLPVCEAGTSGTSGTEENCPVPASPDAPAPSAPDSDVVARFDHAGFRFEDADEETLHDLDFCLRRGRVTAIIGNTGSGKSTIAKLLLRFHDVTSGSLSVAGADVRDQPQQTLRSHLAYVPQKAWLFSGTIAQNLRHGRADAADEELWHALDVAQAGFVRELPDGLATRVAQGGTNFSGGQRQRLAIARALVRHADLYVFDDSFSALDYKTDAALRRALKPELAGAATLIIAQRVSTIRDADQIVVLAEGRVAGLGTHDELMRTCPVYQQIADSQTRGGESDND